MEDCKASPTSVASEERKLDPARFSALRRLASDEKRRFVLSLGGGGVPALCGNAVLVELLEQLDLRRYQVRKFPYEINMSYIVL